MEGRDLGGLCRDVVAFAKFRGFIVGVRGG